MRQSTSTAYGLGDPQARVRRGRSGLGSLLWRAIGRPWGIDLSRARADAAGFEAARSDSLEVIGLRARDWARTLPECYDLFMGVDTRTLLAANVLACRRGRALASARECRDGTFWMSGQVKDQPLRNALLIVLQHRYEADELLQTLAASGRAKGLRIDIGLRFPPDRGPPRCMRLDNAHA